MVDKPIAVSFNDAPTEVEKESLRLCLCSARLFLFSLTGHPATRLRLDELSQFCWHTHFSPRESDVRNRLTEKYAQVRHRRKQA